MGLPTEEPSNQERMNMWVTRVQELPDGEELVSSEPAPSDRELFTSDPRRVVLDTRTAALSMRRSTPRRTLEE